MRNYALFALAVAALVLAGCSAPAPHSSGTGADFATIWADWLPVASIAVLMSAFFVSFGYMLGSFLNNKMIIDWSKSELLQVFASALIIGGLFWLVSMVGAMAESASEYTGIECGNTNANVKDYYAARDIAMAPCHINVAQQYLQIMYENVYYQNKDLLRAGTLLSFAANFNITLIMIPPPWLSLTLVPFSPLNMVFETIGLVFDMMVKIMLLLKLQIYFMSFTWRALFPMMLVLGVILRTFWFSRKLGGLLIAMSMGIYLALPLTYVLAYYVLGGTSAGTYVVRLDSSAFDAADITAGDLQGANVGERIQKLEGKNFVGDVLSVGAIGVGTLPGIIGGGVVGGPGALAPGAPAINNWVTGEDGIIESTAILMIYMTFVPFIALMATISFIKALSPILGGDVEIAGITHLI